MMETKEKKSLFEYIKLHEPVWQITEFCGTGRHGMYKFWANQTWGSNWPSNLPVMRFDGIDWQQDGYASWELVQSIVDKHRAGKTLDDLAVGITREVPNIIWRTRQ